MLNAVSGVLGGLGVKTGERLAFKLVDSAVNTMLNNDNQNSVLSGSNSNCNISDIGTNKASIYRTRYHIGKPTTKEIIRQLNTPLVVKNRKVLASDSKDYQSHRKRKQLNSQSGFNQKTFTFLLEDTFMQIKDLVKLFDKDKRIRSNILKNKNGLRNVYGCIYNNELKLIIKSSMDYYSTSIQIHLVKINDIYDDPRQLLKEITNNREDNVNQKKSIVEETKEDVKNSIRKKAKSSLEEVIESSNIKKEIKTTLKEDIIVQLVWKPFKSNIRTLPDDIWFSDPLIHFNRNIPLISTPITVKIE